MSRLYNEPAKMKLTSTEKWVHWLSALSRPQTQQQKFVNWQGDAEFRGEDFTATVTFGNPDVLVGSGKSTACGAVGLMIQDVSTEFSVMMTLWIFWSCSSGIIVSHYLQSITPSLALGGELVYHRRPGEEGAVMSLVGKYTGATWEGVSVEFTSTDVDFFFFLPVSFSSSTGSNYIATLTMGSAGAHASYYHKANDQVTVRLLPLQSPTLCLFTVFF